MAPPMKLIEIDTESMELKLVKGERQPYTILSHRWLAKSEELSLQDFENLTEQTKAKAGYKKIKGFCDQVVQDRPPAKNRSGPPVPMYVWADTCCINKESQESMFVEFNSMFQYYENAEACYVYLHDILAESAGADFTISKEGLEKASWFKRGWTLQELIAPREVVFFDKEWNRLGSKDELKGILGDITKIDERVLTKEVELESVSIARKMSWAANRTTEKPADMAYCLIGIFRVYLELVHVESGEEAFVRLQRAIAAKTSDQSLFAWQPVNRSTTTSISEMRPIKDISAYSDSILAFARSPKDFAATGHIRKCDKTLGRVWDIGGGKLDIELPLFLAPNSEKTWLDRNARSKAGTMYLAILSCTTEDDPTSTKRCAIIVQHSDQNEFIRHPGSPLLQVNNSSKFSKIVRRIVLRTEALSEFPRKLTSVEEYWNRDKTPGEGRIIRTVYWEAPWKYLDSGESSPMLPAQPSTGWLSKIRAQGRST